MSKVSEGAACVSEEDALRAQFYRLVARLLAAPLDADTLTMLSALDGDETDLGAALGVLATTARATSLEEAEDDYNRLFIGMTRGEFVPYGSYYISGFLNEKPLADLRGDMSLLGIAKADGASDPEDHMASLAEMMAGLIGGDFGRPATLIEQRDFFTRHIAPWASRFFTDLEGTQGADLYRATGAVGRVFMTIETEGFTMVA